MINGKNQPSISKVQWVVATAIFIFGLFYLYSKINVAEKIKLRPVGEHQWAQIDRASMALTYHMDHPSFWLPRCHRAHRNPEGITAGEFPLIPFTVSKLYDVFGFHESLHRGLVLCVSIVGFFFIFLLANRFINNPITSVLVTLCWLLSPNLLYYSLSFLPDMAALSMLAIALYCMLGFDQLKWWNTLMLSLALSVAGLLKLSALLPALAILMVYFLVHRKTLFASTPAKLKLLFAIFLPIVCCILWTLYARQLLHQYHIFTFLMEFMPPNSWNDLKQGLIKTWLSREHYYSNAFTLMMIAAVMASLFFAKREDGFLILASGAVFISAIPLFILIFQKSTYHFYYWIPFQLGIILMLVYVVRTLRRVNQQRIFGWLINASLLVFVLHQSTQSANSVNHRFQHSDPMYVAYFDLEEYLNKMGIGYDKRIATYSDPTYNNSLYLMNRKGWTLDTGTNPSRLHEAFNSCDFAILNDTSIMARPDFSMYFRQKVGVHHHLHIFKLP